MIIVVRIIRVRAKLTEKKKHKMNGVVIMCLIVLIVEREGWVIVCLVDGVGLGYIRMIMIDGLRRERGVAM